MSMKILGIGLAAAAAFTALVTFARPSPVAAPPQAAAQGDILFKQRCAMCHAVAGKGGKLGPDLTGVVGRKAGTTAYAYSPALKASKLVWTEKALDTFLIAPPKMIPGTRMSIAVSGPDDRQAIVSYLAAAGK